MQVATKSAPLKWVIWLSVLVTILALVVPSVWADDITRSQGFRKHVTLAGVREHQAAWQSIADANNGVRTSGTPGYDASAQYVYDRLVAAGYSPSFQEFQFLFVGDRTPPVLQQLSPITQTYVDGVDFATMEYSGSGDVTAAVVPVDVNLVMPRANTSGCEAADFAGFSPGNIALMQRGTCTFRAKVVNAMAAGAAGAIIFNQGNTSEREGLLNGTLNPPQVSIPAVGTSFNVGVMLAQPGATARLRVDALAENRTTRNVIAETPNGDPDRVVVVGAHLDSVTRGPGINDNGSGSAAILEVAEVFAEQERDPRNKVRFIWFGAEEFGLLGSEYYVSSLSQAQQDQILAMLNFDMIGSPNFVRFVYDGSSNLGPPGSGEIEQVFLDYFAAEGLANEPTPFSGRSDYGPFIEVGIPAGGLFTGAEGIKSAAQAATYGGTAGLAYDPCYHRACDTYDNNSDTALDQMSDAVAHATLYLSKTKADIRGAAATAAAATLSGQGAELEAVGN